MIVLLGSVPPWVLVLATALAAAALELLGSPSSSCGVPITPQ